MKKTTLSGCLWKVIFAVILLFGFIYGFSRLFPRAYNALEAKALGIKVDSTTTAVIEKKDTIKKEVDTTRVLKQVPNDFSFAVKLEHKSNCYYIPTEVNGIPMKMLIDTGASNLTLSIVEYEFLRKQELINDSSVEETQATIANGATVKCYIVKIDSVKIGNKVIKDIECNVMERQDAPLLLGMNVLKQLGNFSIDYQRCLLIVKE